MKSQYRRSAEGGSWLDGDRGDGYDREWYDIWMRLFLSYKDCEHWCTVIPAE